MLRQAFRSSAAKVLKVNVISVTHPPSVLPVPCVLLAVLKHTVVKEHRLADHFTFQKYRLYLGGSFVGSPV